MNLIKTLFLTLILGIMPKESNAQKVDYFKVRDSLTFFVCGKQDSLLSVKTLESLEACDTNLFSKNIAYYYYDLGMAYYLLYTFSKDTNWLIKAIKMDEKTLYHKPKFTSSLWNLAFSYSLIGNCTNTKHYLMKYKRTLPKRKWNTEQIKYIERKCGK